MATRSRTDDQPGHRVLLERVAGEQAADPALHRMWRVAQPSPPDASFVHVAGLGHIESSGRGTVYSYVMPHHPRFPFFDYPYIVVLVKLAEGVWLVSNLCDIALADVTVGMPVEVCYQTFDNGLVLHQFRPAN